MHVYSRMLCDWNWVQDAWLAHNLALNYTASSYMLYTWAFKGKCCLPVHTAWWYFSLIFFWLGPARWLSGERHVLTGLINWIVFLGPTWQMEKTFKSSSDLFMHSSTCVTPPHMQTKKIKCNNKVKKFWLLLCISWKLTQRINLNIIYASFHQSFCKAACGIALWIHINNTGRPTGESYVMFSSFKYLSVKGFFTKNQSIKKMWI